MKKYIIWAPKYTHSNGVRVLYELQELLKKRGFEVYVYAPKSNYPCDYIDEVTPEMRKNDIVIYPEIVYHNPLQFQNVVRYILYYPGKNDGTTKYEDYEYKVAFNEVFYPGVDVLPIPTLDRKLFYKDETPKNKECYFVYKRGKWKDIPEFDNMTEINMEYPKTREQLGELLRQTKTFYSYDDCTLILDEAYMCGCNVKIVRPNGFEDYISSYESSLENFENQLDIFIEKTQNMNYTGPIKRISTLFLNYIKLRFAIKKNIYKYILPDKVKYRKYLRLQKNFKFNEKLGECLFGEYFHV